MCRPARCKTCKKTTWAGCGSHVDQVRARIPPNDWCPGHQGPGRSFSLGPRLSALLGRRAENRHQPVSEQKEQR